MALRRQEPVSEQPVCYCSHTTGLTSKSCRCPRCPSPCSRPLRYAGNGRCGCLWIGRSFEHEMDTMNTALRVYRAAGPHIKQGYGCLKERDRESLLLQTDSTGVDRPFWKRPLPSRNFLFPIFLKAEDSISCLIYIAPSRQPANFDLYLWQRYYRNNEQVIRVYFNTSRRFPVRPYGFRSIIRRRVVWIRTACTIFRGSPA